ncbi:DUF2190 family protein [Brevundimonas nasdae]|uniref:DUF2190 family protein n=1 Tax=Brevundimonas nasdae TaxID=172043 RepID=A0ABX8TH58_9CAUL|nr:DUF2190 family protein [Brevundimonas nasdae]QYC10568.1 DUF2190 family protein [Brevundimonas nasdae]QYC13355.1 DUF2190 family protein [Brevundimonas nasdae]
MSKNYEQHGDTLDCIAPAGGVVSGKPVKIGTQVVVPQVSAAEGAVFSAKTTGVWNVAAATGQAWGPLVTVYWDDTAKVFTTTATSNTKCGHSGPLGKASGDAVSLVKLIPTVQ